MQCPFFLVRYVKRWVNDKSGVQVFLLLVAFISVPWMLLGRPYYELNEHKKTTLAGYVATTSPGDAIEHGEVDGVDDEHGHEVSLKFNDRDLILVKP